jgi:hypothetical protein
MVNKQVVHTYTGMQQDTSNSKYQPNFYFEGKNIRLNATDSQSTGSVTNEKGNSLIVTIPTPVINSSNPNLKKITYGSKELIYKTTEIDSLVSSGEQVIIGHSNTRNYVILFTTNNNGIDCIWKLMYNTYDLTLLYLRDMDFSINNPIQTINNFENKDIDKVYWVDSKSQMRFININHSIENKDVEELIDVSVSVIDMVGKYNLSQPVISNVIPGGTHTAGMIQYAYNLYRLNSSQTKISALSNLIPLDKFNQGGDLNEIVGASPSIDINNIDPNYTNIRVYAIKYTSYNEIPSISLIEDKLIPSNKSIQILDNGSIISPLSLEEFRFLGSDIIIPKHINSKDNRLFLANYQEINFDVNLDTRAYSFLENTTNTLIHKDLFLNVGNPDGVSKIVYGDYDVPENHDSINLNYDTRRYQYNSSKQGGEGKYLKYELTQTNNYSEDNKYFKDDEIYRLGIVFYNKYGQKSLPKWIADFKAPDGNLKKKYNTLKIDFKTDFLNWLDNDSNFTTEYDIPVGYKTLIAERTFSDKTIIANGILSPMMINIKPGNENPDNLVKLPNPLLRNYNALNNYTNNTRPLLKSNHLENLSRASSRASNFWDTEMPANNYFGRGKQFTTMLQMYSPEIQFKQPFTLSQNLEFKIKGSLKNEINNTWSRMYLGGNKIHEGRNYGSLTPYFASQKQETLLKIDPDSQWQECYRGGFISGDIAYNGDKHSKIVFDRTYTTGYQSSSNINTFDIYGKPELTEKGSSPKNYNNDLKYRYTNSLESIAADGNTYFKAKKQDNGPFGKAIVKGNTYGNNCITIVAKNKTFPNPVLKYEEMCSFANILGDGNGVIGEIVKSKVDIYLGSVYGGNSYEDKKRTNYIEIGNLIKFSTNSTLSELSNVIDSPGDTFVGIFKFLRMVSINQEDYSVGTADISETVSVLCETTVDLKNRNDLSINKWDTKFNYKDEEYHKYNRVYSQMSNLIQNRDINYNIKKLSSFDTNIIASKLKSAGELIDSWTDILQNEVITLDGKHGSINSLTNFNDQIYGIQDKAFAYISINPRVQIQGDDGISVELGSGSVLQEYKYISTESGTINKWSVVPTSTGIYYYDLLNKAFMMFKGQIGNISDIKGLHSYFISNTELNGLKTDNPLIKEGISSGYDLVNNDIFMTFHRKDKPSFTISYNEARNQFISFYDYLPSMYISKGQYFITTNPNLKSIYRQYEGNYNNFYGQNYPSYIILNVNPEANMDTVFDNIMYKSEVYLNDIDQPDKTLTDVRLYSEYQNSGLIPLTVGRNSNLRRKFRDWNVILPRNQNSRERIRNPWVKLVLQFDNTSNYKLILHDVIISYSV